MSVRDDSLLPKALLAASFEPLVLALLSQEATYGYEIILRIQEMSHGRIVWTANRLYPLLHDLENRKLIASSWQRATAGPNRKYYRLTKQGKGLIDQEKRDWFEVLRLLTDLWGSEDTGSGEVALAG